MKKIYDFFDGSYYINLNKRTDRKKRFEKRIKEVGIKSIRYPAIQPNIEDCAHVPFWNNLQTYEQKRLKANEVGCALSHVQIVKIAKKRKLNNVLIFEDDCIFLEGFEKNVKKIIEELKQNNIYWNIIWFGGQPNNVCTKITDNIYTINNGGIYGLQSYAVNSNFYDNIINMNFSVCSIMDNFLLNYDYRLRRYLLSKKILTLQENNYSDLTGQMLSYQKLYIEAWEKYVK